MDPAATPKHERPPVPHPPHQSTPRHDRDPRVQRTRGDLLHSFNGLFLDRPYDHIQIADIIGDANVGRSTFYEHFHNKDALLLHSMSWMLAILANAVLDEGAAVPNANTNSGNRAATQSLLDHFRDNCKKGKAIFSGPLGPQIARQLADLIASRLADLCRNRNTTLIIPLPLAAAQLADSQLALIREWLAACATGANPCTSASLALALHQTSSSAATSLLSRA